MARRSAWSVCSRASAPPSDPAIRLSWSGHRGRPALASADRAEREPPDRCPAGDQRKADERPDSRLLEERPVGAAAAGGRRGWQPRSAPSAARLTGSASCSGPAARRAPPHRGDPWATVEASAGAARQPRPADRRRRASSRSASTRCESWWLDRRRGTRWYGTPSSPHPAAAPPTVGCNGHPSPMVGNR